MPRTRLALFCGLVALIASTWSVRASDLAYISDDELASELESRGSDISRTRERLSALQADEERTHLEIADARANADDIEQLVSARAHLFYRLSRNGGSLRYLLGSSSATEFLKRLSLLRHLLIESLKSQRQANLRLVEAETRLADLFEEQKAAGEMLARLEGALAELEGERNRRDATRPR